MSELTDRLAKAGEQHKGTDLGGLLQWAVLHIADQDEALADVREEHANEPLRTVRLGTRGSALARWKTCAAFGPPEPAAVKSGRLPGWYWRLMRL